MTRERSSELGLSLIEVLVAVFVLAIVLVPVMRLVVDTLTATNGARLEEEASNLASSRIETVEQEATQSPLSLGTTTSSTTLGADTFTVETSVQAINGTGQTLCTGSDGPNQLAVWRVQATVSWTDMAGEAPVAESTEIAPGPNAPSRLDAAEVALPLDGADLAAFEQPVNYQVGVTAVGGPAPALPADATGSFDDGCIGLADLPAAPAGVVYDYTISLTPNPGLVSANEESDTYVGGPPSVSFDTLQTGRLLVLQPIVLAEGVQASVAFQTQTFAGGTSGVVPAAEIPVTVAPPGGCVSASDCVFENGTVDVTSMLLYPYAGYAAWAGDTPESAPGWQVSGNPVYPGATATEIAIAGPGAGAKTSVTLPVYPLTVQISNAGMVSHSTLTATEVDGLNLPFTLNPVDASGTSVTGLPLGQYLVSSSGGAFSAPAYVWVTPTGVWTSSAPMSMAAPPASPDTSIGSGADVVSYQ